MSPRPYPLFALFAQDAGTPFGPKRPQTQLRARAIQQSMRFRSRPAPMYPYPEVNKPDAAYENPGRGVGGETSN